MKTLTLLLSLLSGACFAVGPIQSQCIDPGTTFKSGEWNLISIPCSAEGRNISDLFGNEGFGQYAENWVLYSYDGVKYSRLPMHEVLEGGRGYWFVQHSGEDKEYKMPDLPELEGGFNLTHPGYEFGHKRGFGLPLETRQGLVTWSILGNPLPFIQDTYDFSFGCVTDNCRNDRGDSWWAVLNNTESILSGAIYTFDGDKFVSKDMGSEQHIGVWSGYWVATLPLADEYYLSVSATVLESRFKTLVID